MQKRSVSHHDKLIGIPLVGLLALAGCVPISSVQSASTLGQGKTELGVEPGVVGAATGSGVGIAPRVADISVRHGVSDSVDVGARFGVGGLELQGKFRLTPPGSDFVASFAPAITPMFISGGGSSVSFVSLALPLLVGFGDPQGTEIVLGPRVHTWYFFGSGEGASVSGLSLMAGTSVGAAIRVSESFKILPEASFLYPLVTAASASDGDESASGSSFGGNGILFQATVGLLFGL